MRFVSRPPISFIKSGAFDTRRPFIRRPEYIHLLSYADHLRRRAGNHSLRQHANAQLRVSVHYARRWRYAAATQAEYAVSLKPTTSRSARRWSALFITIAMQLFYRIIKFSRQLNPRRTAANDGDIDLTVRAAQISRILEEQVQHLR